MNWMDRNLWLQILPGISAVLLFGMIVYLGCIGIWSRASLERGYRAAVERMMERGRDLPWYSRKESWLVRNGAAYHFGTWVNPFTFLLLRILMALAGVSILSLISMVYAGFAGCILFVLPWVLVVYLNHRDNLQMLSDLKHVYHSLEIQTRAGVYVTDALAEIYGSVQEKRLKQALLDLAGDLVIRSDLGEALEGFQNKFDNRYIDSLCMILLQALESGQSVDLLSDLSEQIKDMETAVMGRKKEALDRSVTFYQLGILVAIMGLVLYACVTQMFSAAAGF